MLEGGCFCGFIRYRADGEPFNATVCHCSMCRGTSGTPMVGWYSVARAGFRLTAGELTRFASSAKAARSFCPRCGTQITFASDEFLDEIDVTIASLDDPNAVPPKDHTYVRSKLSWVVLADGLPQFQTTRQR